MRNKSKSFLNKLLVSLLLVLLVTGTFGTMTFAQDYIYLSWGNEATKIKVVPGWNKYVNNNGNSAFYGRTFWYYGDQYGNLTKGWKKINNKWYAFEGGDTTGEFGIGASKAPYEYGAMYAGVTIAFSEGSSGAIYSFKDSGEMITGWKYGKRAVNTGVANNSYNSAYVWYYHDPSSGRAVSGWQKINGRWYYFSQGKKEKHPAYPNSALYIFTGCEMQTGWVKDAGKWYYLGSDGAMRTGWVKVSGKWYYMNYSGVMQTGWNFIGGSWYYMDSSGAMVTGWANIGGKWYYMNSSGAMCIGWQKINGTWYLFKLSGAMACSEWYNGYWLGSNGAWTYQPKGEWKQNDNGWWFCDSSGWYAKNETVKINDVNYTFNEKGYWIGSVPLRFDSGIYYQNVVLGRINIGWDFSLLNQDSDIPQKKLALASLILSADIYDWGLLKDTLADMGFSKFVPGNDGVYDDINRVGYAIASTTQWIGGEKTNVIAVVCRGSAGGQDWESNILQQADGFRIAANNVKEGLDNYIYSNNIDTSLPTKLLITGHSRGAAVANILATEVWDIASDYDVFTYTFACPNTTTDAYRSYYYNIFNINVEGDPVPSVPVMEGGHNKFGQTISMKASVNDPAFIKAFQQITGGASTLVIDSSNDCISSYPLVARHHTPAVYMAALLEPNGTASGYDLLASTINQNTNYELKPPISK